MKSLLSFLFLCILGFTFSQSTALKFTFPKENTIDIPKYFKKPILLRAPSFLSIELNKAAIALAEVGYFGASFTIDSSQVNSFLVQIDLGRRFKGVEVSASNDVLSFMEPLLLRKEKKQGLYFFSSPTRYSTVLKSVIANYHNNGYPFACFIYDSLSADADVFHVLIAIQPGRKLKWDELLIKGDSSIALKPIEQIIGIKSGDDFSLSILSSVDSKLASLSFIDLIKPSEIIFTESGAKLFLYLKSEKSSNFNGVIGLQPNPISQQVGLTGDVQLKLNNTLKRAEQLDFNWRSIRTATQSLNMRLVYPYFFNSPFGVDTRFQLYKRDSTFLDVKSNFGIQYQMNNAWQIKGMVSFTGSNRLYAAASNTQFPNVASLRNVMYGVGMAYKSLDYLPNPRKGLVGNLEAMAGQRTVLGDSSGKGSNFRLFAQFEQFIPFSKRWVGHYNITFESYNAPVVYSNECFRFGGLTSLRGFNEENFLATTRSLAQIELRYLLDLNSAVFLFYDQSFYENRSNSNYMRDQPFGFGFGANIGSPIGIFSIVYALGVEQNNPLDARAGKIHFGYIAYF